MTPQDVDRLSMRDIWYAVGGAMRREQTEWRRSLYIVQAVYNWGGPRGKRFQPKGLSDMYDRIFGTPITGLQLTRDELRDRQRKAIDFQIRRNPKIDPKRHAELMSEDRIHARNS